METGTFEFLARASSWGFEALHGPHQWALNVTTPTTLFWRKDLSSSPEESSMSVIVDWLFVISWLDTGMKGRVLEVEGIQLTMKSWLTRRKMSSEIWRVTRNRNYSLHSVMGYRNNIWSIVLCIGWLRNKKQFLVFHFRRIFVGWIHFNFWEGLGRLTHLYLFFCSLAILLEVVFWDWWKERAKSSIG